MYSLRVIFPAAENASVDKMKLNRMIRQQHIPRKYYAM